MPEQRSIFENENAVSLKEENRIAIRGKKAEFMYIYEEQKGLIKFNDASGVNEHGHFLLPKTFDEPYE
ncbi:MAG: hypothetical protein HKN39_06230, partial [Flavobacteriales bacterium]|nr:hypothetical protein [Flavobacteriales bacterium]